MLDYLKRYANDVRILTKEDLNQSIEAQLPPSWVEILNAEPAKRLALTLSMWEPFRSELQQVYTYLSEHLECVELINTSRGLSLIYAIRAVNGSLMYYEGKLPIRTSSSDSTPLLEDTLPDKLREFYQELHNGWYYYASVSMGISPKEDVFALDTLEWGILENMQTVPVDLRRSSAFFHNGMGDYVCVEKLANGVHAFIWFHDQNPTLNIDFWPVVDTWIFIGFEG